MSGELHLAALNASTPPSRLRELFEGRPSLGRLLAQNPSSPVDLLELLASHADPEVVELVVLNPNTPALLLLTLGQRFPRQLLKNPMFPLMLLESPNLYAEMPEQTLAGLLALEGVPEHFLEWALSHKSDFVRLAVAHNRAAAPAALERLALDKEPSIRRAVSVHPNTPSGVLQQLAQDKAQEIRQLIARNVRTPPSSLAILLGDNLPEVRRHALHNPQTPLRMLTCLQRAGASADLMRLYGTPDPTLQEQELAYLATGGPKAKELAARHPAVSLSLLSSLARDSHSEVRRAVAQNLKTSQEILCALAKDLDHDVRWFVAQNPNTPKEVLWLLAKEERICWELATNPKTDPALLEHLAATENSFIQQCLTRNPNTPKQTLRALPSC
jgi:hypothetical protein